MVKVPRIFVVFGIHGLFFYYLFISLSLLFVCSWFFIWGLLISFFYDPFRYVEFVVNVVCSNSIYSSSFSFYFILFLGLWFV